MDYIWSKFALFHKVFQISIQSIIYTYCIVFIFDFYKNQKIDFEKIEISQQLKCVSCCNFVRLIDCLRAAHNFVSLDV